ncbi:MAG: SDR family NAD(P)-dependent oxidoreductase [Burkholderiaceae bacterium]
MNTLTTPASLPIARQLDVSGRTALVTGGFSGLGEHFAQVLASHGARVALLGRRETLGHEVAARIAAGCGRPGEVRAYSCDVTDAAAVQRAFAAAEADLGLPTIVVNNAGTVGRAPSVDVTPEQWDAVVQTNLSGVFRVAQVAARAMMRGGQGGSIINIASILGLRVRAQVASYAATKAAVVQLTQALALEWAEHRIRVNAIAPGYFETDINRDLLNSPMGQALVSRIPMQRVGQMPELDGPLLLLASDASSFMTGAVVPVDGGHLVNTL